ncbi:hypothetical protein QYF36_010425 [Acer negundo]|nr:hypothetical protein QYF36_010425 [Acer negundo]
MVSSTQCICAGYSPLVAEATAVLRGINLAIETGLVLFVIETDAVDVVNLIHVDEANMADVGLVIGEIISKLQTRSRGSVTGVVLYHFSGEANMADVGLVIGEIISKLQTSHIKFKRTTKHLSCQKELYLRVPD